MDADAVRSVQRLVSRGYESYLVGGCVRDLLLDRYPKDFDIATEARPQQVKRAFTRNCRIIGRRFKLAHLHFDGNRKILEVATFRSKPVGEDDEDHIPAADEDSEALTDVAAAAGADAVDEFDGPTDADGPEADDDADFGTEPDLADEDDDARDDDELADEDDDGDDPAAEERERGDLLILRDNEFGTVEEDAVRRDFTINALFLDPVNDEIIDYVGGIQDVENRVIRTIGDPVVRFQEDPVRILRAAKFAGRLSFHFDEPTAAAMRATSADLSLAAPPRLLEEILRLLRGGHALPSFQILRDVGGLQVLLPHVHAYLEAADTAERRVFWRMLAALDNHIHAGARPSNAVGLGCLFLLPILRLVETGEQRSLTAAVEEVIGPLAQELRLPRRDAGALKRICSVHPRFTATGKRRFRLASFLQDPHLAEALTLFELSCYALGTHFEELRHWREQVATQAPEPARDPAPAKARGRKPKERNARASERRATRKAAQSQKRKSKQAVTSNARRARTRRKDEQVLTIEPETYDLSAFDRELAPREVPRFDTIVESQPTKKRRRPTLREDDTYTPPPPPGADSDAPPPPPASGDDVFGDW